MGLLTGKKILITGIANHRSIAYGIAQAMFRENAELAFTYPNIKLRSRIEEFALNFNSNITLLCDVSEDSNINNMFIELSKIWPSFDGFIHSIAYAPNDQLNGDYVSTVTREGFAIAHDISSYSFVAMAKSSYKMLNINSALVTLTYLGAQRAIPNYNVMGLAKASLEANTKYMAYSLGPKNIRVNAISAGPIKTVASSGIKNFKNMADQFKSMTPIRRMITIEDIGNVAAFLCSNLALGINGEIINVDGGFNFTSING